MSAPIIPLKTKAYIVIVWGQDMCLPLITQLRSTPSFVTQLTPECGAVRPV